MRLNESVPNVVDWCDAVNESGFALIPQAVDSEVLTKLREACSDVLSQPTSDVRARSGLGHACAARNLLERVPMIRTFWSRCVLADFLERFLGNDFGLVRVLFFDKPPDRTWALPWHKDRAIAVQDASIPSTVFDRPNKKAGVPHVMAPESVLRNIVTLRVHLDEVTEENGPLQVIPESHRSMDAEGLGVEHVETIYADAGDVLAMQPMLCHCSGISQPGTRRHRRILHLEFSGQCTLPDGFEWYNFVRRAAVS